MGWKRVLRRQKGSVGLGVHVSVPSPALLCGKDSTLCFVFAQREAMRESAPLTMVVLQSGCPPRSRHIEVAGLPRLARQCGKDPSMWPFGLVHCETRSLFFRPVDIAQK